MVQYQYILPTIKQIHDLAQLHKNAEDTLSSRIDVQVTASTDSDADYAAEVADGRVDTWGNTQGSLGGNIRAGQLKLDLALKSETAHRLEEAQNLQQQVNTLAEAVLETLAIISEIREKERDT